MSLLNKNVVLVLFQYSIVVNGFEKKLKDEGCIVEVLSDDYTKIAGLTGKTDAFVFYLPADAANDKVRLDMLRKMLDQVLSGKKPAVVIGEEGECDALKKALPEIDSCFWMGRPIDMGIFSETVNAVIEESGKVREKRRILIVDDDPTYAGMVMEWIKDEYKVNVVTAGMQAITFLTKKQVDLILLDHDMPVVDGPQVLQMLRQDDGMKDIPVVFLTGNGTKEAVSRVMELKPAGYILKSTTREELLKYLRGKVK